MDPALPPRATALLLSLAAALLLVRLGALPLVGPDEPRYARVAIELSRSGDIVTPTLQGQPWMEKPILYYWLAGAAFRALGETEVAARLPAVLAGIALVGFTALVGARLHGSGAGLHAGFVLATSLLPFAYGRAASMDMLLAACVTGATGLGGLLILGIAGRAAGAAAFALIGLALLAKGPLGILIPGLVLSVALLLTAWQDPSKSEGGIPRRLSRGFLRLVSPTGVLLLLAVAGPWYAAILWSQGFAFVDVFLLNHNLHRFTSTIHNHPGPFLYYVPLLLVGLFPWSGLLPAAFASLRRKNSADLFLLSWLGAPLLLFSAAGSKLPGYILPCLPPLAILVGRAASEMELGIARIPAWAGRRAAAVVTALLSLALAALPLLLAQRGEDGWTTTLPLAIWAVAFGLFAAWGLGSGRASAFGSLRVGGAGLLLLAAVVAPPIVARHESGRDLFVPAEGCEVLAFGAWRTAWMAGYFYNDARVRTVGDINEVAEQLGHSRRVLVLTGPAERRRLTTVPQWVTTVLASGPREHVLLEVARR